jgi:hypothetical protein
MDTVFSTHGEKRNVCKFLVGKPIVKGLLGSAGRKGHIKMNLREIGRGYRVDLLT